MASQRRLKSRNQFVLMLVDGSSKLIWPRLLDDNQESWRKSLLHFTALNTPAAIALICSCFMQQTPLEPAKILVSVTHQTVYLCMYRSWSVFIVIAALFGDVTAPKCHYYYLHQQRYKAIKSHGRPDLHVYLWHVIMLWKISTLFSPFFFDYNRRKLFPSKYIGKWKVSEHRKLNLTKHFSIIGGRSWDAKKSLKRV